MSDKIYSEIVDTLRMLMYGGSEQEFGPKMYDHAIQLGVLLAKRDGVKFDRYNNRLVLVMDALNATDKSEYNRIDHWNDDPGEGTSEREFKRDRNGKLIITDKDGNVVARQG